MHLEREAEHACALLANPATAFQRLILSHIPGGGNSKQMAYGSSKVCFIAAAAVRAALRAHRQPFEWERCRVVSHRGQRGEDYSRYTPDKSVSSIIRGDPSCGWRRPHILGEKRAATSLVCHNEDEAKGRTVLTHSVRRSL